MRPRWPAHIAGDRAAAAGSRKLVLRAIARCTEAALERRQSDDARVMGCRSAAGRRTRMTALVRRSSEPTFGV